MAKIKNTGTQPRGFYDDQGNHIVVAPGEEAEFNMTEADYDKCVELAASEEPPPYEISGGAGGVKPKTAKEKAAADAKKAEADAKAAAEEAEAKAAEEAKAAKKKA
jgi:membrane protein involved in colicin uptake